MFRWWHQFFFLGAMEWCIPSIFEVFLKDTLDAAQNDAENLVVERLRKKDAEDFWWNPLGKTLWKSGLFDTEMCGNHGI